MFDVEFDYMGDSFVFREVYISLIAGRLNIHFPDGSKTATYQFNGITKLRVRGCEY